MKAIDEPPYLTVGTDVSAKYRGAFCEAKIKTTKRLVKVKVTFRHDSSTVEVQDDLVKGPLKVGAVVEVKSPDGTCQEAVINKLTDASWYTVVFDDGDEKTLRRSSLCLKGGRHFAESETLDQLPLTNPEHFGTPVIGKKINRGRRSNHVPEEESSSSSSEEEDDDKNETDELLGKIVCVDCASADKKRGAWFLALVVSPDCSDEITVKKDNILVRSFSDGKFVSVPRKDVRVISSEIASKPDAALKQAMEQAFDFHKSKTIPHAWKTELKEESSSSETEDEEEADPEDASSEEEEEIEPFPEERENFLQQLYKFMEDRGTTINKRPVLGYRNLNLFKLFRLVHKLGGFDNIESGAVWKQVYQDLGIPVLNSAAGYNVKCAYKKYLYGFEEYCRSANIKFHMALPEKVSNKPCQESRNENGLEVHPKPEQHMEDIKMDRDAVLEEEQLTEQERRENEIKPSRGRKKNVQESPYAQSDNENELNHSQLDVDDCMEDKVKGILKEIEPNPKSEAESDEKEGSGDDLNKDEDEEEDDAEEEEDEKKAVGGGEEFECYPAGMKVQVRYDEWIKADKIVRPADKNVPKIKHRKKIKNKIDKEKETLEKDEKYFSKNCKTRCFPKPSLHTITSKSKSKLDISDTKISEQAPATAIEIASILNGLQASESSAEDSGHECDQSFHNTDNGEDEVFPKDSLGETKTDLSPKEKSTTSFTEETAAHADTVVSHEASQSPEGFKKEVSEDFDSKEETEATNRRKERRKEAQEKIKLQVKRGKRSYCNSDDCLQAASLSRRDEKSRGKELFIELANSSSSCSDEDEEEKSKPKMTPTKKYNRLEDRRKSLRTTAFYTSFSDIPDKRMKLLSSSDERLQNVRAKDRKDVWSSIQGQWPKKTLKELFSDSDTEAAASPPREPPEEVRTELLLQPVKEEEISLSTCEMKTPLQASADGKYVEEKRTEVGDKKTEFPSSGSNSVLNTPPTTPESPASGTESSRQQITCPLEIAETMMQNQEEVQSIKSETDSTIEVDSVAGELQDLHSEGNLSPTGFDASVSSSSSNQLEAEHKDKVCTSQKRLKTAQGGLGSSSSKKQKRSHKSVINNKKKSKTTNSSDSEELSAGESIAKIQPSVSSGLKSHHSSLTPRTHTRGNCEKNGEKDADQKEQHNRLPRVYKWSFQMSDLETMASAERISFLQEKLQEIRKHYLSLKSEVASIDRRRKRLKKKETESVAITSSSSSSPSSSSITAAVMLTLADPAMTSSSQNGMSVECR
ncbi:AT-rich interactive domain-containing protein 4B isoform X2 [Rhinatrema bivittatum]|uniref:AT-rich interactive domain-containing protein 4B isoform X2 n=1 Tax=Rhinatrema bivittatum TaxID=194408 RepID=UPI00112852BA|nr:AT-rich interactive domain-containing protein 4B isoform X2 [Rhinatrema bivittatum]